MLRLPHIARILCGLGVASALLGCDDPKALSVEITTGLETDAFDQDPAVTQVSITAIDAAGGELLTTRADPGGSFTLGELPIDQLVRFEVTGRDADGDVRMRGRSLSFVLGALESEVFPVFAQRVDAWARPPGQLPASHEDGLAAVLGERYLVLTGGTAIDGEATTVQFYDMLSLGGVTGGELTFAPRSMAVVEGGRALVLVADDQAVLLNFDDGTSFDLALPEGLGAFAQVAGGQAVVGATATFIVGATRDGEPSDRVLVIANDGTLSAAQLNTPRTRAAATWIDEIGLVIAGGSDQGAGVEVVADGEADADDVPFDPDPVAGAVATLGPGGEQILLLCGSDANGPAPVRVLDLDCGGSCVAEPLTAAIDPLTDCTAHASDERVFLTGHDENGLMASLLIDAIADTVVPLPLREQRRGARVVVAPNGTLAILGGAHPDGSAAVTVEMLFPSE